MNVCICERNKHIFSVDTARPPLRSVASFRDLVQASAFFTNFKFLWSTFFVIINLTIQQTSEFKAFTNHWKKCRQDGFRVHCSVVIVIN